MAVNVAAIVVFKRYERPKASRWVTWLSAGYVLVRQPHRPTQHAVNPSMGAWRKHPVFNSCLCQYACLPDSQFCCL